MWDLSFQWENCFDPETGKWLFQSLFGRKVPSDRSDLNFASNRSRRDTQAMEFLESEVPVEAFPHVETNQCACGVSPLCQFLIQSSV